MTLPEPSAKLADAIRGIFGPPSAGKIVLHIPPMTLADRLELITDTVIDVQAAADANGSTLEDIAGAVETNGNTLTDILAVLEDIRDTLTAIRDQGDSDA